MQTRLLAYVTNNQHLKYIHKVIHYHRTQVLISKKCIVIGTAWHCTYQKNISAVRRKNFDRCSASVTSSSSSSVSSERRSTDLYVQFIV